MSDAIPPKFSRHRHHPRAFTLLEALMAGMILAMSTLAITGSVNASIQAATRARNTQHAAILLDELMSKADLIGPDRLFIEGPLEGAFEGLDQGFTWTIQIEPLVDHYLYEVTATVNWMEIKGQRSASVSTRLDDPAGSHDATIRWDDL